MNSVYYITAASLRRFHALGKVIILHSGKGCPHCKNQGAEWVTISDLSRYHFRRCAYCFG